ncbi:EF-hand domain-containing protein, partial [Durusdinium trenchii]
MASVVPAGTEVTRQGVSDRIGKRGRVMVVKPIARAYILSEHMMSNMAVGDWLLRKKWPPVVALIIALGLHTADFFGAFYNLSVVPGEHQTPVRIFEPTLESSIMSVVSFLAFGVALLSVLTRVHSQLLWMTLRTFDPWATWTCQVYLRKLEQVKTSCRSFSRYRLRDSGDDVASVHDYFSWGIDLVIVLQFSSLLILAEAADIPKDVMRICVAICLIYCIVLSAGPLIWENMPDWDADAKVQLLFFANMAPKSQFVSAYGTMAVLLTKAAVSTIVQKNAFMYLRCHYEYCMDQLDASFAKLAQSDPSAISYSDFRLALQEMGISESHIFAGFNLLDIEQSGKVSLQNFRKCLMDIFAEYPDASHIVLLGKFCQEAFNQTSGYSSLDSMFGTVFSHWRRFKLEEFGECIYQCLTQDPALASLFRREKMRTQALLFAAFVQVALSWLEEKDFRKVDRDMASLGLRHRSYGVEPEYVCMFQIALLQTVSTILNGLSLQAEISWSVVWSHFVVAPFLAGLVDLDSERPGVYRAVKDILLQAKKEPQFVTMLVRNLHGIVGGYCEWSRLFRDPEHEVQHLAMLLGFLIQVFTHSTESSWAVFMQTE